MSVTKLAFQAAMIAATLGASARGDAILTLGLFSSATGSAPVNTASPASTNQTFNLAAFNSTNQLPAPTNYALPTYQPPVYTPPPAPAPAPAPTPTPSQPAAPALYDAYINFGANSFLNTNDLTNGNPQAWYNSSKITGLFGGHPNAQQIAGFDATVLQRVQQTFALSGVPVSVTDNPNDSAAHMLSVVSNANNPSMPGAIGMTNIGGNGFHFLDNSAPYAQNVDQLEWIVAHNVAHELMLSFGVPEINDQTGRYIDSTVGQMSMFLNPNATFSPGAVKDLLSMNFLQTGNTFLATQSQAQLLDPSPVPEPTTLLVWGLGALAAVAAHRARSRRLAA